MGKFVHVLELLFVLRHWLVTYSLKFNFLSFVTIRSFGELGLSSIHEGSKNFVLMSRLNQKWHLSWFAFMLFLWNHLKSWLTWSKNHLTDAFCNFFLGHIVFSHTISGNIINIRGGCRTAATSTVELFVVIVNGFTLDVAAVLDPPLSIICDIYSISHVEHIT